MKKLLLTLDYELFGDGSGDIFAILIQPTDELLRIADRFNVKFTFFVEILEIIKIKNEWENGNKMGYSQDPIKAIETQLISAYEKGHDIQLHIHPQWADAKWYKGNWVLGDNWSLGLYGNNEEEIYSLIKYCKEKLEDLVRKSDPHYQCIGIRAGAYGIHPSDRFLRAIKRNYLKIDSSVIPGALSNAKRCPYDFSNSPMDLGYWICNDEMEKPSICGEIIEFPIFSLPIYRFSKIFSIGYMKGVLANIRRTGRNLNAKAIDSHEKTHKNKISKIIKYISSREYQTWDFCILPSRIQKVFINKLFQDKEREIYTLIGHPKGFKNKYSFRKLLKILNEKVNFKTINDMMYLTDNQQITPPPCHLIPRLKLNSLYLEIASAA